MATRACKGRTKAGKRCKAAPLKGGEWCLAHADEETRDSVGFGGSQPGAGRPALPRPHEVLREKIEADIEAWLAPYERGREARRPVVVGRGDTAFVEMVPDYKLQLEAADAALNRVYGRPKQALEHTGEPGGPIQHRASLAIDREAAQLAHELLGRLSARADG